MVSSHSTASRPLSAAELETPFLVSLAPALGTYIVGAMARAVARALRTDGAGAAGA